MPAEPAPRLSVLKLIAYALIFGVVMFTCIAVVVVLTRKTPPLMPSPNLLYILIAALGVCILVSTAIMGPGYTGAVRRHWETQRDQPNAGDWLLNQFAVITILRMAMLEGWGLLGAAGIFLTGRWPMLAAPIIAVFLMLLFVPSEAKVRAFIERVTGQVPQ